MTELGRTDHSSEPPASSQGSPAPPGRWLPSELSAGVLGSSIFLALEAVAVGVLHHAHLTGPWELRVALSRILPIAIIAALPIALTSTMIGAALDDLRRSRRIALTIVAAVAAAALGWGVTFGRHFQNLPIRLGFVALLVLAAAVAVWLGAPYLASARRRFPLAVIAACAVLVLASEVANQLVLHRLYPPFHVALSVLAIGFASWVGRPLVSALSRRALVGSALCLVVVATALCPIAARDLPQWDNVRFLYVAKAPTLAHALQIAAAVQPVEATTAEVTTEPGPQSERWLSWHDRDFLLVSIDAVRADHVGAYGYARRTTPNIDELAKRGVVFERAYSVMPHTSYSMTSILTGKYMRPLLMQGTGQDSDTMAGVLRTYGYRTAAFYPPSLFAIDQERFTWAMQSGLDFEYRKVEYADATLRLQQALDYLNRAPKDHKLLLWAHFFEPHEPYAPAPGFDFGPRDVDRYDAEIAAADDAVGKLVNTTLERRPDTVVIIFADHGEAFGDHGAYYHGTTVYEEQVRVPLIVVARDLEPRRVDVPVQLIDILPTMLRAMDVPRRPRVRGNDLGTWLTGHGEGEGFAFSECHDQTLLAEASWRLVCERRIDACSLFDLKQDPQEHADVSAHHPERFERMRQRLRTIEASQGTYERAGSRAEGKDLPPPLVRGIAGDGDAAMDVAALLDDADVVLRRKAGEVLFQLARKETAPALSLAVSRDEDTEVRRWCALALTRLGHGAPLTLELLDDKDVRWRRFAALALAESGDARGEGVLLSWWADADVPLERRKELAKAFAKIRARNAVVPLTRHLDDEKLRPTLAAALAQIGDPYARIPLLRYFAQERYVHTRLAIARALVDLDSSREIAPALVRFLGVPDPLDGGLRVALDAKILDAIGGPDSDAVGRLAKAGLEGVGFLVVVPKGGNGTGYRVLVRARSNGQGSAQIRIGGQTSARRGLPQIDPAKSVTLEVSPGDWRETYAALPVQAGAAPGRPLHLVVIPDRDAQVEAFAVVPLADEIPPPPPEPWVDGG